MNLPNKLTMLRIVMIPVFLVFYYLDSIPGHYLWALVVFAVASLTDMIDGMIARKQKLVTDFGILMDPLADKLLVMAAMVAFVESGLVRGWVVIVILAREFLVTSIRLVAAGKGTVIAADKWGKLKTISQMAWICVGLLYLFLKTEVFTTPATALPAAVRICYGAYVALTMLVVLLTVLSGVNYVVKNRTLFADA